MGSSTMVFDHKIMRFRYAGPICITLTLLLWLLPATATSEVFTDDFNRDDGPLGDPWFLISGSYLDVFANRVIGNVAFGTMGYRPSAASTEFSLEYDLCFNGDTPDGGPFHLIASGDVGDSAWGFIGKVSLDSVELGQFFPEEELATAYYPLDDGATYHARLEYLHDINRLSLVLENDQSTPIVGVDALVSPVGPFELCAIAIENYGAAIKWLDNVTYITSGVAYIPDERVSLIEMNCHPNPFNPLATVEFSLPRPERADISILDVTGRRVTTLDSRTFSPGPHTLTWNGRDSEGRAMPSGPYIVRLETDSSVEARKVMLVR